MSAPPLDANTCVSTLTHSRSTPKHRTRYCGRIFFCSRFSFSHLPLHPSPLFIDVAMPQWEREERRSIRVDVLLWPAYARSTDPQGRSYAAARAARIDALCLFSHPRPSSSPHFSLSLFTWQNILFSSYPRFYSYSAVTLRPRWSSPLVVLFRGISSLDTTASWHIWYSRNIWSTRREVRHKEMQKKENGDWQIEWWREKERMLIEREV